MYERRNETAVHLGVATDELYSDSQGLYREVQARRRDSEIVALLIETRYKAFMAGELAIDNEALKVAVTPRRKSGG